MDNKLVYDRPLITEFEKLIPEHKKVLEWVGTNKKVLEIGCHTGYVSDWLLKQGCEITGVELYEPALEKAKPFLKRAIQGNIEDYEVWDSVVQEKYHVILFMHVLEHLVNPEEVLKNTKDILLPGGTVIICLPNISNWTDRWEIFRGKFNYTESGTMDRTHLRFYNYHTAIQMIQRCGFKVAEYSGASWKVVFRILPEMRGTGRINAFYNRIIHKLMKPNLADKVLMFKVVAVGT